MSMTSVMMALGTGKKECTSTPFFLKKAGLGVEGKAMHGAFIWHKVL